MKLLTRFAPAVAAAIALANIHAASASESDILLKVLVRKGILNESEAAAVKAEVAKEKAKEDKVAASKPAAGGGGATLGDTVLSKLDLNKSIDKLRLYGDLRMRYQYEDKD